LCVNVEDSVEEMCLRCRLNVEKVSESNMSSVCVCVCVCACVRACVCACVRVSLLASERR